MTKRFSILFLLAVLLINPLTTESHSALAEHRFVSLEGRFSISLPDRFKKQTKLTIPTPFGNARGDLYEWQIKEVTFGVGYADSYNLLNDLGVVKKLFDGATERFRKLAEANNGNVVEIKKITFDKHPGIEQRANIFKASFIQRTYIVSRRIYQTLIVVTDSQRDERTALGVLDSFKLLSDPEITEEALKAGPGPLPQTPEASRAGSDAADEGLRGPVKSVRTEIQYLSKTPTRMETRSWLTTYNEKRNKLRTETYDSKNNLIRFEVYGYVDGARVSASRFIHREDGPPPGRGGGGPEPSNKKMDTRYQHRFEFKYDEKKRLTEKTDSLSNGDILWRHVYKYKGNQREEFVYSGRGWLSGRNLYILDDKGHEIERTDFDLDGSVNSKISYTYEFDSNGNWTKRTVSWNVVSNNIRWLAVPSVQVRTITYY